MYHKYFKLHQNPFATSPDPKFFYLSSSHEDSVAKCEYAIRNQSGLAVVYGDVGTGKTTILNKLRHRFADDKYTIAILNNTNQTSDTALLKAITEEFNLTPPRTKLGTFDLLQAFLAKEMAENRMPLLFIDEAQDLRNSIRADRDMLGIIKTLTNLMLNNQRLIQIILFGQLELIPLLKSRRELMSRIGQFGFLSPMTYEDTIAMLQHRWQTAGGILPLPFEEDALKVIYQTTKGLPRDLIKVANSALIHAFAHKQKVANLVSAKSAIQENHLANEEENVE